MRHRQSSSRTSSTRLTAFASAGMILGSSALSGGVVAGAQDADLDTLLEDLERVSQEATAKSEEVKGLEDEIEVAERDLSQLEETAATAEEKAQAARELRDQYQTEVNGIAGSKYRGTTLDSVTNALAAENPQNMIDRAAYLGALSRDSTDGLQQIEQDLREAAREANQANLAVAQASFDRSQLAAQHRLLERERGDLDRQVEELEQRIDALGPQQRAEWENKNDPEAPEVNLENAAGVVASALSKLGSPYGWGATGPNQFDCSGLMYWAFQQNGQSIPRTSQAQIAGGTSVSRADLQPGDIVGFYPGVTHVGMYIGNGQVVHASDYGIPVQVVSVDSMPWAGAARY